MAAFDDFAMLGARLDGVVWVAGLAASIVNVGERGDEHPAEASRHQWTELAHGDNSRGSVEATTPPANDLKLWK
jgi:hypothetical protein